ncbi:MAG: hypothetical protein J5753_03195 [Oscillospiraceae bacterium]|nr:hypothetical protein [Oscillospiraceae bacterium]
MRRFVRYVFRSREGFREYLMYPVTALGAFFLVNMVVLIYWIANGKQNEQVLSMYELGGAAVAGISCAYLTDRLLRTSVSFGVSRKTYLRGMLCILPLLAAATAVMIQFAAILTDGIFFLDGNSLDTPALVVCFDAGYRGMSPYEPRVFVLNLALTFCLCITAFGISLLYAGCRNRSNRIAGLIAAGLCSFCMAQFFLYSYDISMQSPGTYSGTLLGFILQMIVHCMDSMGFGQHIPMTDSFYAGIVLLIAYAVMLYLVMFAFFAVLTKRAEICGKEHRGQI